MVQSLLLIALYYQYLNKKLRSRLELAELEQGLLPGESLDSNDMSQQKDGSETNASSKRSRIFKFIGENIMKGAERRLTIPNQ